METTVPQAARRGPGVVNVGSGERMASLVGGMALLAAGLLRPSAGRLPLALGGGYLIYRGVTGHCYTYSLLNIKRVGRNGSDAGIKIDRAVTINRPRAEVYRFWRNLENLPRFMQHLETVRFTADRRSHWVARGPLGASIEWDAEIVEDVENEWLEWSTMPGSAVRHSGWVRFADAPGGRGTEVYVSLTYNPPGGSAGAALAKLLGREPAVQVREDLRRFKQIMEAGEAPTNAGQSSAREGDRDAGRGIRPRQRDTVTEASKESFPASDSPAWTMEREAD